MNRLQTEVHRLYLPGSRGPAQAASEAGEAGEPSSALIDPRGKVRALVMELTRPPSWDVLSRVWHGVQTELALPAPAIAVSGTDGLQLWFSLDEPVAVAQAHAFLESLRVRFVPEVEPGRLRLLPASNASALQREGHARLVPALQEAVGGQAGEQAGNWSAFVAADLAPVFADTPWIDIPPNEEGQAALLHGLTSIEPAAFEEASRRLRPGTQEAAANDGAATQLQAPPAQQRPSMASAGTDPKRFLLQVMNDDSVALALRIEAAKALLQHADAHRPPHSD